MYFDMEWFASISTAAALAGFVECLVFGRLEQPHVVYTQSKHTQHKGGCVFPAIICIGYARELNKRVWEVVKYRPTEVYEGLISTEETDSHWQRLENDPLYEKLPQLLAT